MFDTATVTVDYDGMGTATDAAEALVEWIRTTDGPVYVTVTDLETGDAQTVRVDPTALEG